MEWMNITCDPENQGYIDAPLTCRYLLEKKEEKIKKREEEINCIRTKP